MRIMITLFLALLPLFSGFGQNEIKHLNVKNVIELKIESSINPATFNYLVEGFNQAVDEEYDLILITMNTPGGLVTTTKNILSLFGASDIPVVVWVKPEGASATSAGAIIASGAHGLYMSEGTNIGAATPIQMSGDIKQTDLRDKAVNDLVALVQSLAETRGRNTKLFGEMIEKASSFKSKEAAEKKLIDGIANTKPQLWRKIDGRIFHIKGEDFKVASDKPIVKEFGMDTGLMLLNVFANPTTAYVLFLIGAALLYLELQAPGGFIAGAMGAICLVLAGIGFQVLPLNFGALGLIVLSFVFFVLEVYVTSYGLLALAGLAALVSGSLFLFRTDDAYIELSHTAIFSSVGAVFLFMVFVLFFIMKDHKNIGKTKFNDQSGASAEVLNGGDEMIEGHYHYQVKVNGEIWNAKSKEKLKQGDHVKVKEQSHMELII